jgi:hypothetical protein
MNVAVEPLWQLPVSDDLVEFEQNDSDERWVLCWIGLKEPFKKVGLSIQHLILAAYDIKIG